VILDVARSGGYDLIVMARTVTLESVESREASLLEYRNTRRVR
jgi:hypothetical protein